MSLLLPWLKSWKRSEAISAVFFLCFMNGVATRASAYVHEFGLSPAFMSLFGISALVLIAFYLALRNVLAATPQPLTRSDLIIFSAILALNLIATPIISWLSLTFVAAREYLRSNQDPLLKRGAALMIGATVPMFWGRLVFSLASSVILKADATLVSLVTGTARTGNVVALPNGGGFLWIADACSSFGNISLAMLCWLMFMEYRGRRERTPADYITCFYACLNVVVINITRISIIAVRPDLYNLVHGPWGAMVAGYLTTFVVILICSSGIKREQHQLAV
ncbi:hypothetical protein [Rhizobium sp. CC-YZS058]|uniref:hypothetical protein n=1 Tax=Rhizobium sp. CC-YZS058 TaxID=3042153 RepID=UPI002B05EFC5|nr:hypothetical protein [Rhizobium sp. CC-YZS058]MEA3535446.1 hypothetical protein [Rhizobium sp. CC-YZS058]